MKLSSSIPSTSVKLIDLYNKITAGSLILGPDFQRKLVWKKQHKFAFIDTILMNFPFPEIYIASDELDISSLQSKELVVDGKQRLSTIVDYIQNRNDFQNQNRITPFDDLETSDKKEFLNYLITVKDLKDIGQDNIIEVFKRINSTNYSLNSNEILNAEFGGGEFAIFCKQLIDKEYLITEKETSILVTEGIRNDVADFFENNAIFSGNDIKRMFDSQYLMLIVSTILEGSYFGRSSKINHYLEKYNDEFSNYQDILNKILNSIKIVQSFKFSPGSYWFNKANLYTLLVEFNDQASEEIDLERLELSLIELENKVDLYYLGNEDDLETLTADEKKYFEVARQGSHELAAREHRGAVIKNLILEAKVQSTNTGTDSDFYESNLKMLEDLENGYAILHLTETGLKKHILDAVSNLREYLMALGIHDYSTQQYGPDHKKVLKGLLIKKDDEQVETDISFYRSNGRGDYRMWIGNLNDFADSVDDIALTVKKGKVNIYNLTKLNYGK